MVFSKRFELSIPNPLPREGMVRVQIPSMSREFVVPKREAIYAALLHQLYPQAKPTARQFNRVLGSFYGNPFPEDTPPEQMIESLIVSGFLEIDEVYAGSTKDGR